MSRTLGLTPGEIETYVATLEPEERELFRRVDLGLEIEAWFQGNSVGRFIAHIAELERESAIEQLIQAMRERPDQHELHRALHFRIQVVDAVRSWLGEAIETGRQAQAELQSHEASDTTGDR